MRLLSDAYLARMDMMSGAVARVELAFKLGLIVVR
jgi:hypothetical protein